MTLCIILISSYSTVLLHDLALQAKPTNWIVDGLLPAGNFIFFAGHPKSGRKTFTAMHLGLCIATGQDFVGFRTRAMPVYYLSMEDGQSRFGYRGRMLGVLDIQPPPLFECRFEATELAQILEGIREHPRVVIVDSFSMLLHHFCRIQGRELDENSSVDMTEFVEHYRRLLAGSQSSIIVIHHFSKYLPQIRGSSALTAASDGWWSQTVESENIRRLSVTLRDGPPKEVLIRYDFIDGKLKLSQETEQGGEKSEEVSARDKFLTLIRKIIAEEPEDYFPRVLLASRCGVSKENKNFKEAITALTEEGSITYSKHNGQSGYKIGPKLEKELELRNTDGPVGPEI